MVLLSNLSELPTRGSALKTFDDVIRKPVRASELIECLGRLWGAATQRNTTRRFTRSLLDSVAAEAADRAGPQPPGSSEPRIRVLVAEDNIVNALRRTILRGTLVCRPLFGKCTVTVQLDGKTDQECVFNCDVLHKKEAFALKSKTCYFFRQWGPYALQMYGHYLRLRVRGETDRHYTNYLLAVEEDDGDGGTPSISALQRLPLQLRSCTRNIRAFVAPPPIP